MYPTIPVYNPSALSPTNHQPNQYNSQSYSSQPAPQAFVSNLSKVVIRFAPPGSKPESPTNTSPYSKNNDRIRLSTNRSETLHFERLADLYAILTSLEHLETAFLRDAINVKNYSLYCNRFLAQYKTWMDGQSNLINNNIDDFVKKYRLHCPAALNRVKSGLPATAIHGGSDESKDEQLAILDIGERFITAMDTLKLNIRAVDDLAPLINDILDNLNKFEKLPSDHDSRQRIGKWITTLRGMRATDEIDDDQSRQLHYDLETSYNEFRKFLAASRKR